MGGLEKTREKTGLQRGRVGRPFFNKHLGCGDHLATMREGSSRPAHCLAAGPDKTGGGFKDWVCTTENIDLGHQSAKGPSPWVLIARSTPDNYPPVSWDSLMLAFINHNKTEFTPKCGSMMHLSPIGGRRVVSSRPV